MPATLLSHQALVLPLKMRWPRRFSGLALCLGSMAPDLEFIGRMRDDWVVSHRIDAQLWFTIPLTTALVWLVTVLLVPTLLPYLRNVPRLQLHDLAALEPPRGWRGWGGVALSAWIGGMSHVILDGVTHGNHSGWLVPLFPVLRRTVPHPGGAVPLHDALQLWLTLAFAAAAVLMWRRVARKRLLWRWRGREARQLPPMPQKAGVLLLSVCGFAALEGALVGLYSLEVHSAQATAAALAFGAIDFAALALLLSAAVLRLATRTGQETASLTPSASSDTVPPTSAAPRWREAW